MAVQGPICGGFSPAIKATEEVKNMVNELKPAIESAAGKTYEQFSAILFRSQVVAGTNFRVKTAVSDDSFIHLFIFRPLPHTGKSPFLTSIELGKTYNDPL